MSAGAENRAAGSVASWACQEGFPPATIFPFTPPERIGIRNLFEFQTLMFRPMYWLGKDGRPGVDFDLSLALPPEWDDDGRRVTVTLKPWQWSNGEPVCADNVMFWVNMMAVKGARYGNYTKGFFPDNLESYEKVSENQVAFTFDKVYSKTWVLMNQLSLITPMPKAWDRTADGPANASADIADIPAVYDYLVEENGAWTLEDNAHRGGWATSPVWSVVNGPWRLKSFGLDGVVTFVPNENYSGPVKPTLAEFREYPTESDHKQFAKLQEGTGGPDSLQVGYLPYGLGAEAAAGTNPLAPDYRLVPQNIYLVNYMPINFLNPGKAGLILAQTYVRQALQCSLDQDAAIRDIFDGYGYRTTGPVPAVPDSDLVSPRQRGNPMPFDLDRARTLLVEHGWDVSTTPAVCVRGGAGEGRAGDGVEACDRLSFSVRYVEGRIALLRLMEQFPAAAAQVGIELRLEPVNGSVMVAEDHRPATPERPLTWEIQTWNGGWAFYGHPTGEVLFKTGGGSNFGHYSDPRADELIERTVVGDDIETLYEYQDYLAEQVPVIWSPGFPLRVFAVDSRLRGFEPVNPYGMLTPENWYYVED